jgi:hypothetical protein
VIKSLFDLGIPLEKLRAAISDSVAVNVCAMKLLELAASSLIPIECFGHILHRTGEALENIGADKASSSYVCFFSNSPGTIAEWRNFSGVCDPLYS